MQPVGELLPEDEPLTLPPRTSVFDACVHMRDSRVGAVLIQDGGGLPMGVFTERDLMTRVVAAERDPKATTLEEVMTRDLYFARADLPSSQVRREMQRRHIRHAPVVDEKDRVIAMLSLRDLLRADLHETRNEVKAITQYIQGGFEGPQA
ncbi:MAG: CBS domain-containing protein [Planctomycetes bacterium]|nr:CBS domain-containing protein [Planctomycetota bacterium]